jgi:hypothetical protein
MKPVIEPVNGIVAQGTNDGLGSFHKAKQHHYSFITCQLRDFEDKNHKPVS